jgi:uncharacterized small protein (DUF1192 family)
MAAEYVHSPTPEDIMEFVDGEGTPAARAGIEAHLATCAACQALVQEQRSQSRDLAAWRVAPAPDSLKAPARRPLIATFMRWQPSRVLMAGVSVAAVLMIAVTYPLRGKTTRPTHAMVAAEPAAPKAYEEAVRRQGGRSSPVQLADQRPAEQGQASHGPAVIRTATLQIIAKDFSHVRSAVEVILDSTGGFADQLALSADPGSARVLRGTLRVPGARLTDVLTRLRALGQVTQDQQNAQDVADQLVDLDSRLRNARATEQRLNDLLKNRTGRLTDVLEVEQQITRVRLEIERLDAEKTNMTRRVAYATIDLTISEERKAGLDPGPLPLLTQLRVAAADGLQNVVDTVVGITLFALRAGPSLVLWGIAGLMVWITVKRVRRTHFPARSTASE